MAASFLEKAATLRPGPEELQRAEAVQKTIDLALGASPHRPVAGRREIENALAVVRALCARGVEQQFGYYLIESDVRTEDATCRAVLMFATGGRRFGLEVGLRDAARSHRAASERFAISHKRATPPGSPSELRLAQLLLVAIERHVR